MPYVIAKDTFFKGFDGMETDHKSFECNTNDELTTIIQNIDDHKNYELSSIRNFEISEIDGRLIHKVVNDGSTLWYKSDRPFAPKTPGVPTIDYVSKSGNILQYASEGSAGVDLPAYLNKFEIISLDPGEGMMMGTGICVDMYGHDMMAMVCAKSGLGTLGLRKVEVGGHGIALSNGVGIIDSDYRGEVKVGIVNNTNSVFVIKPGDLIAQMVFLPVIKPELNKVAWLKGETERSNRGFGEMTEVANEKA